MGEMNIKLRDDRMLERLADLAKEHNRTPESEALEILAEALSEVDNFDRLADALRISAMTPKGVKQTDSTILVQQDRQR
jgi:plasmid stability protein